MRKAVLSVAALFFGAALVVMWPSYAQLPADKILLLVENWYDLNSVCHGSSTPGSIAACEKRTLVSEQLEKLGHCYGKEGESGYQMQWHPCGSGSLSGGNPTPAPTSATKTTNEDIMQQIFNFLLTGDPNHKSVEGKTSVITIKDRANCIVEEKPWDQNAPNVVYYFGNITANSVRFTYDHDGILTQFQGEPFVVVSILGKAITGESKSGGIFTQASLERVQQAIALLAKDYCKFKNSTF